MNITQPSKIGYDKHLTIEDLTEKTFFNFGRNNELCVRTKEGYFDLDIMKSFDGLMPQARVFIVDVVFQTTPVKIPYKMILDDLISRGYVLQPTVNKTIEK